MTQTPAVRRFFMDVSGLGAALAESEVFGTGAGERRWGVYPTRFREISHASADNGWTGLERLDEASLGRRVMVRARLHHARGTAKNAFLVLRGPRGAMVQAVVFADEAAGVSREMVKFASSLPKESVVDVSGVLVPAEIKSEALTLRTAEIRADFVVALSVSAPVLPFQLDDASRVSAADLLDLGDAEAENRPEEKTADAQRGEAGPRVTLSTRLDNRVIDLRTSANQAIFRMQAAVVRAARAFLENEGFVEIHSPKLIGAASEGGASVFRVSYFKGAAFLAQSPQFYKQMAICGDMGRVFEVGPVFRAENSFTHRHMTEFTGLDVEMVFSRDYHEAVRLIARMLLSVFRELEAPRNAPEAAAIRAQFPAPRFVLPEGDDVLILPYAQGAQMLRDAGVPMSDAEDLSTEKERRLGALVREKYGTDFYVLDKYPLAVRPFYTMPCAENPTSSNSYDVFMRGEEIMSGAQRVHDPALLEERIRAHGVDPASVAPYVDAFRHGVPPHAGGGIGLERIVMLYFDLRNIRRASLFPRDPHRITP